MQIRTQAGHINQTIYSQSQNKSSQSIHNQQPLPDFSPLQLQNKLLSKKYQQQYLPISPNHSKHKHQQPNTNYGLSAQMHPHSQQQRQQFINSNSIVKRYQLLLITLLIMSSIASVRFSTQGTFNHIKTITDRLNIQILGNTNPSIYQFGDNIDESSTQFVIFEDINDHFDNLIENVLNFTIYDSFIEFERKQNILYAQGNSLSNLKKSLTKEDSNGLSQEKGLKLKNQHKEWSHNQNLSFNPSIRSNHQQQQNLSDQIDQIITCDIEVYYLNGQYEKNQTTIKQLEEFLFSIDRREFLLNIKEMQLQFIFAPNKRLQELNLTIFYSLSSKMMLNVELQLDYLPDRKYKKNSDDSTIRILEQVLAFLLLCSYLHNAYTIKLQNTKLKKFDLFDTEMQTLQLNRAYWCYSLVFLNIITMLNETYAPLSSFLQLLPIFERHDSANVYKYNFNTNLRYALPIVMRIFIPVVILLNGFIFYSMLMYPGEYFQDYATGFFSYVYQNFQVGTYEIFIQIQNQGNFAYLLYGVLYFYMVLVGSNLLPALFCTMIYIKIYQNDLKDYIQKTIKSAVCPKCNHQNLNQKENKHFQINIQSPKISPYLKGKLSTVSNKNQEGEITLVSKVTKMFVESQKDRYGDKKLQLKSTIQKVKSLMGKLELVMKEIKNNRQLQVFDKKIQKFTAQIQESLFILSPINSPLHRHG